MDCQSRPTRLRTATAATAACVLPVRQHISYEGTGQAPSRPHRSGI
uniref:Predicted protein n=1 Tax=Hordeum vulgare subsp. vulgare TaxID=112509 RepID=F2D2N0_HORVV|nr:predicted protein [Hordeum vulgare subsp. vulgare]